MMRDASEIDREISAMRAEIEKVGCADLVRVLCL
jgi:hypothetical protein